MLGVWIRDQDKIRHALTNKKTTALKIGAVRTPRYPIAEKELQQRFQDRRRRGHRVSGRWLTSMMIQLVKDHYQGAKFVASAGWLHRCCSRFGIAMRTKSNGKCMAVQDRLPAVLQWLANYRFMLSTAPTKATTMHPTWGRFPPHLRYNCDQVSVLVLFIVCLCCLLFFFVCLLVFLFVCFVFCFLFCFVLFFCWFFFSFFSLFFSFFSLQLF